MTRLATQKRMLTVIFEETEHWQMINHDLNIGNVVSFARLTRAQLERNVQYDPAGGNNYQATALNAYEIDNLVDMQERVKSNMHARTADWLAYTPDDFALFQNGLLPNPTGMAAAALVAAATVPPVVQVNPVPVVPLTSLTSYGLKRDLKDFPEIKERHLFKSWMDSVHTVAIMHNSDHPLDPLYTPGTCKSR
jgi:hypothetical protein